MMVGALLWAAFTRQWDTTAIVLGAGGLLALAVGIGANWPHVRDWFRDPRGVFILNSIFTTLLLVAILGLVNAVASFKATRIDVTAAGRNTLTADTRTGLAHLGQDVVLKEFGRTRDAAVDQLLSAFANVTTRVRMAFLDVDQSPQEARTYGIVRDGTVIVAAGDKWRKVEKPTEPALFAAITQVTQTREPVICFATGEAEHGIDDEGSDGLSQFAVALKSAGYRTERVSLQGEGVPRSCEVVIIAGPRSGLTPDSFARLDTYMNTGGRLALLIDPPVDAATVAWLLPRGILTGQGVIIDNNPAAQQVGAGPERPLALPYSSNHAITRGFEVPTIFDRAVPLAINPKPDIGILSPLLRTSSRSFERTDVMAQTTEFREGRDHPGPFLVAVASELHKGLRDDKKLRDARFVVFGDSGFLTNALVGSLSNRDLGLRVVAWLAGEEEARVVSLNDRQNRRTSLTEQTRNVMYAINMGLLPLIPLLAGIIQLFRSRR